MRSFATTPLYALTLLAVVIAAPTHNKFIDTSPRLSTVKTAGKTNFLGARAAQGKASTQPNVNGMLPTAVGQYEQFVEQAVEYVEGQVPGLGGPPNKRDIADLNFDLGDLTKKPANAPAYVSTFNPDIPASNPYFPAPYSAPPATAPNPPAKAPNTAAKTPTAPAPAKTPAKAPPVAKAPATGQAVTNPTPNNAQPDNNGDNDPDNDDVDADDNNVNAVDGNDQRMTAGNNNDRIAPNTDGNNDTNDRGANDVYVADNNRQRVADGTNNRDGQRQDRVSAVNDDNGQRFADGDTNDQQQDRVAVADDDDNGRRQTRGQRVGAAKANKIAAAHNDNNQQFADGQRANMNRNRRINRLRKHFRGRMQSFERGRGYYGKRDGDFQGDSVFDEEDCDGEDYSPELKLWKPTSKPSYQSHPDADDEDCEDEEEDEGNFKGKFSLPERFSYQSHPDHDHDDKFQPDHDDHKPSLAETPSYSPDHKDGKFKGESSRPQSSYQARPDHGDDDKSKSLRKHEWSGKDHGDKVSGKPEAHGQVDGEPEFHDDEVPRKPEFWIEQRFE